MEPFCYKAKVVRVVDGDTMILDIDLGFDVVLRNQSVRLYKVDTPECRTRNLKEKAAGKLAKKVVDGFVNVGDSVVVKTKLDSKGKFGRLLGIVVCLNVYYLISQPLKLLDNISEGEARRRRKILKPGKKIPRTIGKLKNHSTGILRST